MQCFKCQPKLFCVCLVAGHEGTPGANGFDRKIWASGELLPFTKHVTAPDPLTPFQKKEEKNEKKHN